MTNAKKALKLLIDISQSIALNIYEAVMKVDQEIVERIREKTMRKAGSVEDTKPDNFNPDKGNCNIEKSYILHTMHINAYKD